MFQIFFDADGFGWVTCTPSAEGAVNFGPDGTARHAHHATGERLHAAHVAVYESGGWLYLDGPGWDEEGRAVRYG
jgi:hypothetical protein